MLGFGAILTLQVGTVVSGFSAGLHGMPKVGP